MNNQSSTPETDGIQRGQNVIELCRRLERERDEARRERDNAISDWKQADTDSIRAIHERNEARKQRDKLTEALGNLIETCEYGDHNADEYNAAIAALASVKETSNAEVRHGAKDADLD